MERTLLPPRPAYRSLAELIRDLPGTAKRFWVLVIATGLASGLGAVALVKALKLVQRLAWSSGGTSFLSAVESVGRTHRFLVATSAGALVTIACLLARRPLRGHGTAGIIEAIWAKSGRMPFLRTVVRAIVSITAVGLGAPLGREGALLQIGAATGSSLASRLKISADQARLLVACGASAGIAAAYNVPIGAALFGLEVLLGSFALELFGPIVLSSVVATLVSRILISDHPSYLIPHYKLTRPKELLLMLIFGPVLGVLSAVFVRTVNFCATQLEALPQKIAPWLPVLAMGGIAAVSLRFPQILGNGYDAVNDSLLGKLPLGLLLILPALKLAGTAFSAGAGIPGGMFTPSLFVGALAGGAFGQMAERLLPGTSASGAYALLGMGAILAGTTHASVSAVLIIFELTGNYDVMLPLMLASVLATAVSRRLEPESLYSAVLRRRNVSLPRAPQPNWLKAITVRSLIEPKVGTVGPQTPFEELVVELLELPAGHDLYVTDPDGKLLGVLVLDQLKGHIPDHHLLRRTVAADVMSCRIRPVEEDLSVSEVALRFSETSSERLPVVDRKGHLLGTISKRDVLRQGRF